MPRRPIARQTLADKIAEQLRQDVISGRLAPGDPLPTQRQLAADFGASTNVVREGLRTLQAAGLVEVRHGSGTFVSDISCQLTPEELDQHTVVEARCMLEVGAIEQVIARIDRAGLARLERILERGSAKLAVGEPVLEEDLGFHTTLLELSGNAAVAQLARIIEEFFRQAARDKPAVILAHYSDFVPEHGMILELIRSGDVHQARRALRQHILTESPSQGDAFGHNNDSLESMRLVKR